MAIDIKFDLMGNPEPPTIILANRNGNKLGQLSVNADSIDLSDKFNDASELSFTLNKYVDDELTPLWDKVVDFKLVYCKEWDEWFEIKVELDEATETVKTVFCTQLGQAELSQIMLYNIEINTDVDIERDDYKISILYDADDPEASILYRVLKDKAPHYSIAYVSPTITKIQRNFSFDGTSIYDAFQEIAEEIGCLFLYYASINEDGVLERKIAVHDLQQTCNNESCGYRGEFTDKCPKCGGTDITNGYGEDTLIFVTADELGSQGIELVTDTDSVKNCFKLEGGDDLMTATIRNCNPNGTDYIWYFSDSMKEDMSEELVQKIESYDEKYKEFYNEYVSNLDTTLLNNYNNLVKKYRQSCIDCGYINDEVKFDNKCPSCGSEDILINEDLETIDPTIKGYPALMNAYYNTIDLALYLESGLMPSVEMSETNAAEQLQLLVDYFADDEHTVAVNVEDVANVSLATANSAVLSMAKVVIRPTYKIEIKTSTLSENRDDNGKVIEKSWNGSFIITNYSDEEDTATNIVNINVTVNNDTENFIKQKIEKALNKENTEDLSISGLFNAEKYNYDEFCDELKKYGLNPLKSFSDACETCRSILIDQGAGSESTDPDSLYQTLYLPYVNKSQAITNEIITRENEIAIIKGVWNKTDEKNPTLITKGLQQNIEECRNAIQAELNFETYLGETLWLEFCAYRREDKYSNDNYISDGLNNAEVFEKALEFIDVAENEIYKSSELQHSISTTLNNLLAIPKFKPLADSFKTGNWIRVQVDDKVHKLRLLEYDISFGDFNTIPVEFSDVTKIKNGTTDVQDVFAQASSMATSYSSVQRQASQGGRAKTTLEEWISDGLSSANVQIQSNDTEDITLTKHGLLARSYDDVTQTYSPEQLKITHNIMAYTDDNWKTVRQAIGKHEYKYFDENENKIIDKIGYGQNADFVNAGVVSGSQIIGGDIYSANYPKTVNKDTGKETATGSYINLTDGTFSFAGGRLVYNGDDLTVDGKVTVATEGTIACWNVNKDSIWKGSEVFGNANGMYFGNSGLSLGNKFKVTDDGIVTMTDANVSGTITSSDIIGNDIKGGTLLIGDENKIDNYAEIANDGTLTCTNVNIQGGTLAIGSEKDEEGNPIAHTWISEDGVLTTYDAHIQGTLTSPAIIGGTIEGTEIKGVDITAGSTLKVGQQYDGDGNVVEDSYLTWILDDGVLHAQGAVIEGDSHFTGEITATSLTLANDMKIGDDENGYHTWISTNGVLNANGANITGIINATEGGTVGGWNIGEYRIASTNNATLLYAGSDESYKRHSLIDGNPDSPVRFCAGYQQSVTKTATVTEDISESTHTFIYSPSDCEKITDCTVTINNGGGQTSWSGKDTNTLTVNFNGAADSESLTITYTYEVPNPIEYAPFATLEDGSFYANNARISGHIEADSGKIGSLEIHNSGLEGYTFDQNEKQLGFILSPDGLEITDESARIQVGNICLKNNLERSILVAQGEISLQTGSEDNPDAYIRFGGVESAGINEATVTLHAEATGTYWEPQVKFYLTSTNSVPYTKKIIVYYDTAQWGDKYDASLMKIALTIPQGNIKSSDYIVDADRGGDSFNKWLRFSINAMDASTNAAGYLDETSTVKELCMNKNATNISDSIVCETFQWGAPLSNFLVNGNIMLDKDKTGDLGSTTFPWTAIYGDTIYATTQYYKAGSVLTSDVNKKNTIEPMGEKYSVLFDSLNPVTFKLNDGTSGRTHMGLIAQELKSSMDNCGIDSQELAAYCSWEDADGNETYGIRYGEFISLCIYEIQKLKKRVAELESK